MKMIRIIIILSLVLLTAFFIAKNIIVKTAISTGVKAIVGLRLSIEEMKVGMLETSIDIKNLKLYNPPEFADKLMVDMPEIYVDYDLGAFLRKKVHLEEVKLNLKEFIVVKDAKGRINLNSLKAVKVKKGQESSREAGKEQLPEIQVDKLDLKVGKVIYKDYSSASTPTVKEFEVNIDEQYENITDPYAFVILIVVKALANTAIGGLANFDLGPPKQIIREITKSASELTKGAAKETSEAAKEVKKESIQTLGQNIEETTGSIRSILPFGK